MTIDDLSTWIPLINAIITMFLVILTWRYLIATKDMVKATRDMGDTMYRQFVYENKPYVSVKCYQKEPKTNPVLEFRNESKKSQVNIHFDIHIVPPDKALDFNMIEEMDNAKYEKYFGKPSDKVLSIEQNLDPDQVLSEGLQEFYPTLKRIGVDILKPFICGIMVKYSYIPDILGFKPFINFKYWVITVNPEIGVSKISEPRVITQYIHLS